MKTLDSRLEKEAKWNRFYEYQTISSCVGIASVGSKILPAIDRILSKYLTPQILSIECGSMFSEDGNSDKENISAVANPPITKYRGRPETKQYKAAMEKVTENVPKKAPEKVTEKARRQPYTCRSCGKTGHNSTKWPKKGS
ncbi:hypothetical protein F8M41_020105 [Gigaspora margarita]|uniref:CCHC-type domain-containing protein n=1 Tax=Gigaspora margarita TaxID=4874 RepID=A0A8H4AIW0_GIGMA|nr:hypothetical protein F8M41_020105 [Gigaspora margarita]